MKQRLLVSVMSIEETVAAVKGGAHIVDAEDPSSALGVVPPLTLREIRGATPTWLPVSTNIGEKQRGSTEAAQAALAVATSGVDMVKVGLAGLNETQSAELVTVVAETIRYWFPGKMVIPATFADLHKAECPTPEHLPDIATAAGVSAVLVDTFDKEAEHTLFDLIEESELSSFIGKCHKAGLEAWVAGSLDEKALTRAWRLGVDVACVRGAACYAGTSSRTGSVSEERIRTLISTIPIN